MSDTPIDTAVTGRPRETPIKVDSLPDPFCSLLARAIDEEASDIHLDPVEDGKQVRFRVDGVIHMQETLSPEDGQTLLNLIKVNAFLRTDKSFTPDEGLIVVSKDGEEYDVRASIVPVFDREAIHLRFISASWEEMSLADLGMNESQSDLVSSLLDRGNGMILVAGPTGGGKTTTMYNLARSLDLQQRVVTSMEDPVEFAITGVRQVQVNKEHGLTMAAGLRTLLRMDPECVMVGEIRDEASATMAARASLIGRLVMATIHAPDATTAVFAMLNLAVPRYVLGGALSLIITQDLLPRLCQDCAQENDPTAAQKELYEECGLAVPDKLWTAKGCDRCHNYGYDGRVAVFEMHEVTSDVSRAIASGEIRQATGLPDLCGECGTMVHDALRKAAEGTVGIDSAMHVASVSKS